MQYTSFSPFFFTREPKRNYHYEYKRAVIETDTISSSTVSRHQRFHAEMISMFIRDNENSFDSRGIHFVASLQHGKLNSSELCWFHSLITRKKRAVTFREWNGSSDDIVRFASTMLRNKENGRILLSCDSLCLKCVPQPRLVLIISCLLVPRCQNASNALDSFFFREPPFSFVICSLLSQRFLSFAICVFFFFICITIQASAFIAYSILACKIIYIYILSYESRIEV